MMLILSGCSGEPEYMELTLDSADEVAYYSCIRSKISYRQGAFKDASSFKVDYEVRFFELEGE